MIIYYSGDGHFKTDPEDVLDNANVMLTYINSHKKNRPEARLRRIIKKRKLAKKENKREHQR